MSEIKRWNGPDQFNVVTEFVTIAARDYDALLDECARLRGDIKTTEDVLQEFDGGYVWQQAQQAVADRDRLAAECKALSDQCQDVRAQRDKAQAELSAARALLREARGGCVGTDSPWLGSDQQEAWCYLVDALIGAAPSAGSALQKTGE